MKIAPEQLTQSLQTKLYPIYIISGDEGLLVGECLDSLRQYFKQNQFVDREVFHVEAGFDWQALWYALSSQSLFSDKKSVELRFSQAKIDKKAIEVFTDYAQHLKRHKEASIDTVLVISLPKLDNKLTQSKWFQALASVGVWVLVWPISTQQWPGWLKSRLAQQGLNLEPSALAYLADRVEGNLLAAHQEILKLKLYCADRPVINQSDVEQAVVDSSRYSAFNLVDSVLLGEQPRAVWILQGLKEEGVPPILVLGALVKELRKLALLAEQMVLGQHLDQVLQTSGIWPKTRMSGFRRWLRHFSPKQAHEFIVKASEIDHAIKGLRPGNPWILLNQLCVLLTTPNRQ